MKHDPTGYQISHSGQTFTALGTGPHGHPIWPVGEFIARTVLTEEETARLIDRYPNGFGEEGHDWNEYDYETFPLDKWHEIQSRGRTLDKKAS